MTSAATPSMPCGAARRSNSLRRELHVFSRSANARVEVVAVMATLVARMLAGPWSGGDALVIAALIAAQPFFEWAFHMHVLHYRPLRVLGWTIDFELARKHREHHADPADLGLVFVPMRSLVLLGGLVTAICLTAFPTRAGACTALSGAAVILLAYEWTHYLIHSSYRPRTRLFTAIRRAHRLHHFRNEQYWFGVLSPAADVVLRTYPSPAQVPVSLTAKNLPGRDS